MTRRRLLDLCCGAGGLSTGYARAGFDVTGVDIVQQPRYPFRFVQADALDYVAEHGRQYDLIHASWPCEHFAPVTRWRGDQAAHEDLITPGRKALQATGRPWVMENVPAAPLRPDYLLCGTQFGLPIRRHRVIETSWGGGDLISPCYHHRGVRAFLHQEERAYADAMGCPWMTAKEARKAVPPAYAEYIAEQYLTREEVMRGH